MCSVSRDLAYGFWENVKNKWKIKLNFVALGLESLDSKRENDRLYKVAVYVLNKLQVFWDGHKKYDNISQVFFLTYILSTLKKDIEGSKKIMVFGTFTH